MLKEETYKEIINTDFSVSHNISRSWTMTDFHFHDAFEIYFSLSDNIKYLVNNKIYQVGKNDILVLNNMDFHKSTVPKEILYERYIMLFNPLYIEDLPSKNTNLLDCFLNRSPGFSHKIHVNDKQAAIVISLFEKANFYLNNSVYGADVYKFISLAEMLLFINSLFNTENKPSALNKNGDYKRVESILEYINEHLSEDLSLDNLSAIFYLSKYHMGFLFKKATGSTITEYIINMRILKARKLLRGGLSVSQVAEMVGFNNYCHFIRTFKELVGIPPKQYSKIHNTI